jgi:hypothetical protein
MSPSPDSSGSAKPPPTAQPPQNPTIQPVMDDLKPPKDAPPSWQRFKNFVRTHRTRTLIVVGVLLIAPTAAWAYIQYTKPVQIISSNVTVLKKKPQPTTVASPLTGLPVSPAVAKNPVVAVVIENLDPNARPQSGLSQAGVVYEALAEGGITRFLAFFEDSLPPSIGPVRSLRPYFIDWALEFNAPVIHAGGSATALAEVGPLGLKDINALYGGPSQYFMRTTDRVAPHNLYTTGANVSAALQAYGFNGPPTFTPSPRKKDQPTKTPAHPDINIDYSYNGYQVEYKYVYSCNCYDRWLGGVPHIDRNTGQQIQVKNVVVEYMPITYGTTSTGEQTVSMATPGSGQAIVFRDGGAVTGTWSKSTHTQRTQLLDANGKPIPLDAGNTWYSIVPTTKTVSY